MAKPRKCPHCQISIGKEYTFDENLNFICKKCGKVAYPAVESAEFSRYPQVYPQQMPFDKSQNLRQNKAT